MTKKYFLKNFVNKIIKYIFADMENNNFPLSPVVATEEEKQWVKLLATGQKANDIADQLGLNKNTFAYHLRFLRTKFQCQNTIQLVSYFLRNKIID